MSKVYGDIELLGGGTIINMAAEKLETTPEFNADDEGRIIYNTTEGEYQYNNGSTWVSFQVATASNSALIETLGSNWINGDYGFNPVPFNNLDNISGLTADDSLFDVISQLDSGITTAQAVETLQGVTLNFEVADLDARNILYYDGANFVPGTINDLDTIVLSVGELDDITLTDVADNQTLVYQGGDWINVSTHFEYQDLSGTVSVFVIPHNLGTQFCNVEIIDMSGATPVRIDPSEITSISYDSTTQLTVTLTGNKAVTILVSGMNSI